MKKITALMLYSLLTTMALRADVVFQDTFNYTNGQIIVTGTNVVGGVMVTNWIRHSGSGNDAFVNNHRLEVSSTTANGGVTVTRADDVHRNFSITNNSPYTNGQQVLYASFIVNFTNLPLANGQVFAHFSFANTSIEGKLWGLIGNPAQTTNNFATLPNTFRLGVSAAGSGSPSKVFGVDLALNTDYQVVLGWNPTANASSDGILPFGDTITLWVNPVSSGDTSVASNDPYTGTAANVATAYAFRQATGFGGFLTVSNLVVATTFAEAATNVLSTNAVAPKIVYQPVGVTNFVGSTVTLSAVAAGQGQASMTYQWFQGATPVGSSTNVLTIANAQTTDSGNYTVVASTPYGLSATSSVAKVLISAAPVPPAFVTQPVSQTLYRGQNLILTTTVSSPGNCTFTWYSNNTAVATTGPDNSGASTFEIDNVVTANSATYKVAVTNDVVLTNGIVSTNAVVTVINPPGVTIAYLRSLVDPNNNYAPTNTTQPFQITGIVTTYTNLTTANTSSYYLQDATAGINIFATFGSTFRPAQGDVVTFVGLLSSYSSGLELAADTVTKPYTSYTIISNNFPLPAPMSIPFTVTNNNYSNMNYTIAGRLVQLSDVFFATNSGNIITNGFVTVTNSLGQKFNLWVSSVDLDVMGQTWPTYASSVTGVMFGSMNGGNPNFAVAVTKWSDINTNVPSADVSVVKTGPGYVFAQSNLTYSITVSNAGPDAASSMVVTDSLPEGVTFVSATGGGVNNSGVVTWSLGTLASNATASVTVTVTAPVSGSLTNTASVGSDAPDPNPANNTSSQVITVVAPIPIAGPIAVSGGNATVSWNASGPSYSVLWSTNVNGPYSVIASGLTSSPYTDTAHTSQTTGFYKITSP